LKEGAISESIKPLNREPVSLSIMNMVTDYLLSGTLRPGDKLPTESELARQLGVGRNSVREAMKMLSSLGVIEIKRGVGTFIAESISPSMVNPLILGLVFDQGTSQDLIELRLLIDTGVADLAMQKATTEDIEKLERANRRLKSAAETLGDDSNSLRDLDLNFHMTLLEVTRNRLVAKLGRAIYTLFMASIEKSVKADPYKAYANHELVINAIKRRDRGLIKRITSESLRFWMATIDS